MAKYFWREKNAEFYIDKYEIIVPSKQQLFVEIKNKFEEKLEMSDVIFDTAKRNEYLAKKNKNLPANVSEFAIQQQIGTRVIVDFLQLIKDMSELNDFSVIFNHNEQPKIYKEIYASIKTAISNFDNGLLDSLQQIYDSIFSLINLLELSYENIEKQRKSIEEKEGSFYNGKIVLMWGDYEDILRSSCFEG